MILSDFNDCLRRASRRPVVNAIRRDAKEALVIDAEISTSLIFHWPQAFKDAREARPLLSNPHPDQNRKSYSIHILRHPFHPLKVRIVSNMYISVKRLRDLTVQNLPPIIAPAPHRFLLCHTTLAPSKLGRNDPGLGAHGHPLQLVVLFPDKLVVVAAARSSQETLEDAS